MARESKPIRSETVTINWHGGQAIIYYVKDYRGTDRFNR